MFRYIYLFFLRFDIRFKNFSFPFFYYSHELDSNRTLFFNLSPSYESSW